MPLCLFEGSLLLLYETLDVFFRSPKLLGIYRVHSSMCISQVVRAKILKLWLRYGLATFAASITVDKATERVSYAWAPKGAERRPFYY
jgi:hypothetical protein